MSDITPRPLRHRVLTGLMVLAAAACYVGIVTIRHGPAPGGDTVPLTEVTSELSSGDLHAAAANASLPNPPGYALLASPFVAALRSLIGSPNWCTTNSTAVPLHPGAALGPAPTPARGTCVASHAGSGSPVGPPLPHWYRSQGLLGVLAWLILAIGGLGLLRAARADTLGRTAGLLAFLAFLPAASSAIVQFYHPQDIVSLGLGIAGLAQVLRHRWALAGLLLGVAFVTKQFAILILLPALASAPDRRSRLHLLLPAIGVIVAAFVPFLLAAPHATVDNLSGVSGGGAQAGATVLTLLGLTGNITSAIARDAPVVFAAAICLWAQKRRGPLLARPEVLLGLTLSCVGSRLVFESVLLPYYLLATSVVFFMVDLVACRLPHRSLTWSAGAAFFVAIHPGNRAVDAFGTLVLALLGVLAGMAELTAGHSDLARPPPSYPPDRPHPDSAPEQQPIG